MQEDGTAGTIDMLQKKKKKKWSVSTLIYFLKTKVLLTFFYHKLFSRVYTLIELFLS
jgi:hypothetical protein